MPAPAPETTPEWNDSASPFPMTPLNSRAKSSRAAFSSSPNLKEISESVDREGFSDKEKKQLGDQRY